MALKAHVYLDAEITSESRKMVYERYRDTSKMDVEYSRFQRGPFPICWGTCARALEASELFINRQSRWMLPNQTSEDKFSLHIRMKPN